MGRIDRYVLRQLLWTFGMASLILVLVYWLNRAVALFDQLIRDGQSASVMLEFTALSLPPIVRLVLPLAAFAATLWAVNRLLSDSEITVAGAAGMSPWRLARPVLAFGLIVAAMISVLGHLLAPLAAQRLGDRTAEIAETATAGLLREGEFVSPVAGVTLYIREIAPEGELRDLLLSDRRDPAADFTYTASRAYLVRGTAAPSLVMVDGLIERLSAEDGRLLVTAFDDLAYDLSPFLGAGAGGRRSSRELFTGELLNPTPEMIAATRKDAARLFSEAQERFAEAVLAPVAVLIAFAALMAAPFSRLGLWRQILLAVVLIIVVKGVESVALGALRGDAALWPLAYLPSALGLLMAAALLAAASRPPAGDGRPGLGLLRRLLPRRRAAA